MPIEGVYSSEEQRALVYEYLQVLSEGKAAFLEAHGLKVDRFRRCACRSSPTPWSMDWCRGREVW